jgi:uncharacterized protein (DUF1800 family)
MRLKVSQMNLRGAAAWQKVWAVLLSALAPVVLVACGGGCQDCNASTAASSNSVLAAEGGLVSNAALARTALSHSAALPTRQEAARFLTQATFGPTPDEVSHLMQVGYEAWIDEQLAMPVSATSHVAAWDASNAAIQKVDAGQRASSGEVTSSFWREAITGKDQLRQRMAFALSEIYVVSINDSCGSNSYARGAADYLDMLGRQAFGSYRALLESVSLHPVMGCYLSSISNRLEDSGTGRVPDENFAREIMQLFSIGLYELQPNGALKRDASLQPIETYGPTDISGLAKVFTGWSWWCPLNSGSSCFGTSPSAPDQYVTAMRGYTLYHDKSEKRFLKTVVPASWFATPQSSLKAALDALATHPNVAPFIGKQLIQRLVTSNPSPAYVERISAVFNSTGGHLGATVKAILLDAEARDMAALRSDTFGKVREPVLKLSALMRAAGVKSESGQFLITTTGDPGRSLAQSAMASPSVFNFYRPGYVLPGSKSAGAGLLTPELQIANETSAAGYVNFLSQFMWSGTGRNGYDNTRPKADVQLELSVNALHPLLLLSDEPGKLVAELDQRLMYGTMPATLRQDITSAIAALDYRAQPIPTPEQILNTRRMRTWSALLLIAASPDFQIQR